MVDISGTTSLYGRLVGHSYLSGRGVNEDVAATGAEGAKKSASGATVAVERPVQTQAQAPTQAGGPIRTSFSLRGFAAAQAAFQFVQQPGADSHAQVSRSAPQLGNLLQGETVRYNPQYATDEAGRQDYLDQIDKRAADGTDKATLEVKRLLKSLGLPTDTSLEFSYNSADDQTVSVDGPGLSNQQRQQLSDALNSSRGDKVNSAFNALRSQVSAQRSEHATQKALGELEPEDPQWSIVEKQLAYFAYEQRASEIDHGATATNEVDRSKHNFSFSLNGGDLSAHFTDSDGTQRGVLDFKDPAEVPAGKPAYKPWFYAHDPSLIQKYSPISIARA